MFLDADSPFGAAGETASALKGFFWHLVTCVEDSSWSLVGYRYVYCFSQNV
jgi:hypothetical protein